MRRSTCRLIALLLLCCALCPAAGAQKSSEMRCPRMTKDKKYYKNEWRTYTQVYLGYSFSKMYRNEAGSTGEHFRFASRPRPYLGISQHLVLSDRWDAFAGLELSASKQGLKFSYGSDSRIQEYHFAGALIVRLPVGVTYHPSSRWQVSAAPYLAYYSVGSYQTTGTFRHSGGTDIASYTYRWEDTDFYNSWMAGLKLGGRVRIRQRLYADLMYAMDFASSAPSSGNVRLGMADGGEQLFTGRSRPWLLYFGAGLSYRLFEPKANDE